MYMIYFFVLFLLLFFYFLLFDAYFHNKWFESRLTKLKRFDRDKIKKSENQRFDRKDFGFQKIQIDSYTRVICTKPCLRKARTCGS